jgi:predicted methyltransferase
MYMKALLTGGLAAVFVLTGCQSQDAPEPPAEPHAVEAELAPEVEPESGPEPEAVAVELTPTQRLQAVLAAQPEEVRARYPYRNPAETLSFFGIEPGMTVVEMLPGGGWYSRILSGYLGPDGTLIGANYPQTIWSLFGFMSEERIAAMATWAIDWPGQAFAWGVVDGAHYRAFVLGALPDELAGTADAVVMIRAMHNLARFDAEHGFMQPALADVHAVLKPGGIAGVVQHEARPEMPDDWSSGENGYIKRDFVVAQFEAAGFELVDESDINANPFDQPTVEDSVWRLPPNLRGADDEDTRKALQAIGESNRMTLKFRKPE